MAAFHYRALTPSGVLRRGQIDARNEDDAIARLRAMNTTPMRVRAARSGAWTMSFNRDRRTLTERETALFFSALADLDGAGLPLDEALDIIGETLGTVRLKDLAKELADRLRDGASLSEASVAGAAAHMPRVSALTLALLRIGEASGSLAASCRAIADNGERAVAARKRLQDAIAYPALIALSCFGALIFLSAVVVPSFLPLFASQGVAPPVSLLAILAFRDIAPILFLLFILTIVLAAKPPTKRMRSTRDRLLLNVPFFGRIAGQIQTARFMGALSAMLKAGMTIADSVPKAQTVLTNRHMIRGIERADARIRAGRPLAEAFRSVPGFPPFAHRLLPLASRSGSLTASLEKIAAVCERDAQSAINTALQILTPALIVSMGALVGLVVASLFGAVLDLNETVL